MPTVKTVSITYARKLNLGNYQSAELGVTVWADLDEDEELHNVMTALWETARNNVRAEALRVLGKANSEEVWLGLPENAPISERS